MTRSRLTAAGTILLVITLLITVAVVKRDLLRDGSNLPPIGSTPPSRASESILVPGLDAEPRDFRMVPVEEADGPRLTTQLSISTDAPRFTAQPGLSFDARELANPMWGSEDSNLMLTLGRLDRPPLRFGGNGIDRHLWWTSDNEPPPAWAEVTVTPEDLERVAQVAEEIDATVTIALDLGHDDPARAADMAGHARTVFGDRLLAVSIGNEPNGFFHPNQPQLAVRDSSWSVDAYQRSLTEYSAALEQVSPGTLVDGPGAYDASWWRAFTESEIPNKRALSMHWYPLWDCDGPASSIANPTVSDLTSPALRERTHSIVTTGANEAAKHDLPLWMEETGPTSCPGTNETSLTHAQALWTVDYSLTLAELGVERTAFHSTLQACDGGAPMSSICAQGTLGQGGLIVEGRTSFLALLMLGHLPDGTVLDTRIADEGWIAVHSVLGDDGRLGIVVVDLRDPADPNTAPIPVELIASADLGAHASYGWKVTDGSRLSAATVSSTTSRFTVPAPVSGELAASYLRPGDALTVTSEPGTAMMLRLDEQSAPVPSAGGGADHTDPVPDDDQSS